VKTAANKQEELLLLAGHGFAGTTAGAGIGAGALTANRQTHTVTTTTQATDVLEALHRHALLAAKVTLKGEGFGCHPQFLDIAIAQILNPGIRINATQGKDLLGPSKTHAIDVSEGDLHPLVAGDIYADNPSHWGNVVESDEFEAGPRPWT
jgi:hypothetical protein